MINELQQAVAKKVAGTVRTTLPNISAEEVKKVSEAVIEELGNIGGILGSIVDEHSSYTTLDSAANRDELARELANVLDPSVQ